MTKIATKTDNGTKEAATAVPEQAPPTISLDYLRRERARLDEQKQQTLAQLNAVIGALSWIEAEIRRLDGDE